MLRAALYLTAGGVLAVAVAACGRSGLLALGTDPLGPLPVPHGSMNPPLRPFCDTSEATLAGCYRFDGDALDGSRYALGASAAGVSFVPGVNGLAIRTTGASSVVVAANPLFDGAPALTVEMWVRPEELPGAGTGQRRGLVDKNGQFGDFVHEGGTISCAAAGVGFTSTAGELAIGSWSHVACVFDGTALTLVVDGIARGSVPAGGAIGAGGAALQFGEDSPSGGDQLVGAIDDLRLWTRALSPAELCSDAGGC